MKRVVFAGWVVGVCCVWSLAASAAGSGPSEVGVRDVENIWSRAFVTGDAKALDDLLDPAYVSVSTNGVSRPKGEIIAAASRFAAEHPNTPISPLPPTSTISLKGDTAVVTHHGAQETSVDVFYYRQGHWHAWYSQHTKVTPVS
ncbi:nuclear transport factor 2 family protein [Dyella subtropica]|uniref:nuclear transport factor 2 family protein n=1 Tax=Dyella subtropica TaxID=2992127 RepID=UPI00224DE156|nr:nuclear transport factor 2 family protein [Dyella subtropica]